MAEENRNFIQLNSRVRFGRQGDSPSVDHLHQQCSCDAMRLEFEKSPLLQKEFGNAESYVAFKKAEAHGLVQIVEGRTVS